MCIWIAQARCAAAAQAELLPGLCTRWNTQLRFALDGGDFNLRPQGRFGHSDRHRHIDIVTFAREVLMPPHVRDDVKIARRRAQPSAFALGRHAHARTSIDTCRYSHFDCFSFRKSALAFTERARRAALAGAAAIRTLLSES